jgi:hypothetical protein
MEIHPLCQVVVLLDVTWYSFMQPVHAPTFHVGTTNWLNPQMCRQVLIPDGFVPDQATRHHPNYLHCNQSSG